MEKIKELCKKHREILMYLLFGVLTTAVGWIVYFAVLWAWKGIFSLPVEDTSSGTYIAGYTVAQVVQWIAAVLFAFFTNRKWVFTEADRNVKVGVQLVKFSGGRVITFFIDYGVTLFAAMGAAALIPALTRVELLGKEWNLCEIGAKVLAAVIVIICNYIFSKIFVFKNKKEAE
jgi:putative flippase GtrA